MLARPPAWASRIEYHDPDEVRARFASYGPHQRDCVGRGVLRLAWSILSLGSAAVGWQENNLGQRVRAHARVPLLHLPLSRPLTYRVGRRYLEASPGHAVLIAPGTEYRVSYGPASESLGIQVHDDDLRAALRARGVDPASVLSGAREVPLTEASHLRLERLLTGLHAATPPPAPVTDGARLGLVSWFAESLVPMPGVPTAASVAESRLRHLEEWLDEHLAEPIDVTLMCAMAGIEARGLHKRFCQRRGVPPMRWVQARRMAAARMRLMEARRGDTVIQIALEQGITHAGRFSVNYRRRYGESPSATLARCLELG